MNFKDSHVKSMRSWSPALGADWGRKKQGGRFEGNFSRKLF